MPAWFGAVGFLCLLLFGQAAVSGVVLSIFSVCCCLTKLLCLVLCCLFSLSVLFGQVAVPGAVLLIFSVCCCLVKLLCLVLCCQFSLSVLFGQAAVPGAVLCLVIVFVR